MHLDDIILLSVYIFSLLFAAFPSLRAPRTRCNWAGCKPKVATGQVSRLFPRTETGHLLFLHSDMKRYFYFCRPAGRRGYIPPLLFLLSRKLSRKLSRGNINATFRERRGLSRVSRRLTIWISLVPSKNSCLSLFLPCSFRRSSNFPYIPSLIVLRATR